MRYKIPVADPYITEDDVMAVAGAVKEKRLSQGEYVQKFEGEFARYIGVKHAVAVCNGTAALHVALAAISVGKDDEVITPSFSFAATANCALYEGAKPVFADIDPLTYNVDPLKIEQKTTNKTKAIIPVHYGGQPADMDSINELAKDNDMYVIEDAAEAHGALYRGRRVGGWGDLNCFSFYPNKNMTTGEGGIITTNDDNLVEKMRMIRSHGQDRSYHHVMLGYNYRMTDFQAALGSVQLKRLDWVLNKKVEKARYYDAKIKEKFGADVKIPYVAPHVTHTYMFYTIRFTSKNQRDNAALKLAERSVETRIAFPPIHLQPLYQKLFGYRNGYLKITEEASDTVLSLPIYPHITPEEQDHVISSLEEAIR